MARERDNVQDRASSVWDRPEQTTIHYDASGNPTIPWGERPTSNPRYALGLLIGKRYKGMVDVFIQATLLYPYAPWQPKTIYSKRKKQGYAGQQVVLITLRVSSANSGDDETLTIQAENAELGDGKSQFRVRTAGAAFTVRMNVQFAISALERMSGAQVQLSACVAGMKPVTFCPMEGILVHVVMPMSVR